MACPMGLLWFAGIEAIMPASKSRRQWDDQNTTV
jgi:hypothetical protein